MKGYGGILLGGILLIVGVLIGGFSFGTGFWDFGASAWIFFKGGVLWAVLILGVLLILLGINDLKK